MSKTKKILQLSGKFHKCGTKFLHFTHFWNFHHSYKKSVYWVAEWAQCTCELSSASDKWQYYCAPTPLDFLLVEVGDADNECTYHIIGAHNLSSSSAWSSLSSILRGVEIDKAPFISIQDLSKITRHPNTTEPYDASATWVQRECHNAQTTKWLLLFFFFDCHPLLSKWGTFVSPSHCCMISTMLPRQLVANKRALTHFSRISLLIIRDDFLD